MRMIHGVHGNTSYSWPGSSSLRLPFIVRVTSLANGLVSSAPAGNNPDHGSAVSGDGSSGTTGQSNSSLLAIVGVTDDDGGGA